MLITQIYGELRNLLYSMCRQELDPFSESITSITTELKVVASKLTEISVAVAKNFLHLRKQTYNLELIMN